MRFEVLRSWIRIVPENEQDEAFIEDTLGLRKEGDFVKLVRQNVSGANCVANLRTERLPEEKR